MDDTDCRECRWDSSYLSYLLQELWFCQEVPQTLQAHKAETWCHLWEWHNVRKTCRKEPVQCSTVWSIACQAVVYAVFWSAIAPHDLLDFFFVLKKLHQLHSLIKKTAFPCWENTLISKHSAPGRFQISLNVIHQMDNRGYAAVLDDIGEGNVKLMFPAVTVNVCSSKSSDTQTWSSIHRMGFETTATGTFIVNHAWCCHEPIKPAAKRTAIRKNSFDVMPNTKSEMCADDMQYFYDPFTNWGSRHKLFIKARKHAASDSKVCILCW